MPLPREKISYTDYLIALKLVKMKNGGQGPVRYETEHYPNHWVCCPICRGFAMSMRKGRRARMVNGKLCRNIKATHIAGKNHFFHGRGAPVNSSKGWRFFYSPDNIESLFSHTLKCREKYIQHLQAMGVQEIETEYCRAIAHVE